jgi:DNA repair exonuclease SbcCD ATPase subunit
MLQKLRITNWKAFEERTISFGPGLNLFVGPNGSGKTTLLDAICLDLTGEIPTGDFKALIRDKSKDAEIELVLELAGVRYSIRRRFRRDRLISAEWTKGDNALTQPGWDALSSTLARELKTDPVFFSRMIYMSEVEVFDYAKNPPSGALNTALERVLGIDSLGSIADFAQRLSKGYAKSVASLRQELARSVSQPEEPAFDDTTAREQFENNKTELEAVKRDLESVRAETQRLRSISDSLARAKNLLDVFMKESAELGIDLGSAPITIEEVQNLNQAAIERTKKLDDHVTLVSSEKGSVEATVEYLTGIQSLLLAVSQKKSGEEPACPVCERPIDKDLASRLIEKTRLRIAEGHKALVNSEKALQEGRSQLQKYRGSAQRLNSAATQLVELAWSANREAFTLDVSQIDEVSRTIAAQVRETGVELQSLTAKSAELTEKVTAGASIIGRAEGRAEISRITQDFARQLVQKFKGSILADILVGSLHELAVQQRDEGIKPLYLALAELWKRWRPEHEWTFKFDTDGRIELESTNTSLTFSQLSGGEKTVLLILSRVLMLGFLSKMDFLMIDEPLEHLDVRNRRAVLNFLVASTKCGLVQQAVVTTFEESLIRKYLDGQNSNTVYLSRAAA